MGPRCSAAPAAFRSSRAHALQAGLRIVPPRHINLIQRRPLALESREALMPGIVMDRVERVPAENGFSDSVSQR